MAISKHTQKPSRRAVMRFRNEGAAVQGVPGASRYDISEGDSNKLDDSGANTERYIEIQVKPDGTFVEASTAVPRD